MRPFAAHFARACRGFTASGVSLTSFYDTLGVRPGASADELKRAYRREAMKWHPDRHKEGAAKVAAGEEVQARLGGVPGAERRRRPPKRRRFEPGASSRGGGAGPRRRARRRRASPAAAAPAGARIAATGPGTITALRHGLLARRRGPRVPRDVRG